MTEYIDPDSTDIDECIEMLLVSLKAANDLYYSLRYPMLTKPVYGYDKGRKYSRVWYDNGTQRFVAFFVQRDTGDVWKADGWKGPALNFVRGNVLSLDGRAALTVGKINPKTGYFYPAF